MISLQRLAVFAIAACAALVAPAFADGPVVTAPAGAVEGVSEGAMRVFRAPLGGAVMAAEILYLHDLEV